MRRVGRVEAWLGLAAGAYGVIVTAITTVLISQTGAAACGQPRSACIAGINSTTVFFLVAFAALYLLAAAGAALHGFRGSAVAAALLWLSTAVLALLTMLGMFSIGIVLFPGTLVMIGAAIISWTSLIEQRLTWYRWIEILAGASSGVLGVAALVALFFLPSIQYDGSNYGGTFSIASFYGLASVLPVFLLFDVVAYIVAGAATAHAEHGSRTGRALLALATVALICVAIVGLFVTDTTFYLHSVGHSLAPSTVLAVIAMTAALIHPDDARPAAVGGV